MNIEEVKKFDEYMSEHSMKPDTLLVHPSRYKFSEDKSRMILFTVFGIYCYRDGIGMGEAMNEDDANLWITENKEIVMWT